jgi:hypothetical protein
MRRRLLWILALLIVLVVGGAIAVVVVERPTLEDGRDAVDNRWKPLQEPLTSRYAQLTTAQAALVAAGFGDRSVSRDLKRDLAAWDDAVAGGNPGTEAEVANRLEADGKRLKANAYGSPVLTKVDGLVPAITGFDSAAPSAPLVDVYNKAVRAYEKDRNHSLRKPVARLFGFDARPVLVIETEAPPAA